MKVLRPPSSATQDIPARWNRRELRCSQGSQTPTILRSAILGFTLLELLTVIAIMAILMALTLPAFNNIAGNLNLTRATDMVIAQCAQARATAIAKNRNVELRLYSYKDESGNERYHALQAFATAEDPAQAWSALGRVQKLPQSVTFDTGSTYSPLIATQTPRSGTDAGVSLPGVGTDYRYVTITFRPDGFSSVSSSNNFLTILAIQGDHPSLPLTERPNNYAVIQINPITGRAQGFRP